MHAVIHAVLDLRGDGTGQGGIIDPDRAFRAMCLAIGMMASDVGVFETARARREFVDRCRKDILIAINAADDRKGELAWMKAKPLDIH